MLTATEALHALGGRRSPESANGRSALVPQPLARSIAFFQAAALARILPAIATDGTGSANLQRNSNDAPFETWRFQSCFRDPLGGPSRLNLSDGLAVSFCS